MFGGTIFVLPFPPDGIAECTTDFVLLIDDSDVKIIGIS